MVFWWHLLKLENELQKLRDIVKDAWSYFSKFCYLFHMMKHHSKDINSKFQLKRSSCLAV